MPLQFDGVKLAEQLGSISVLMEVGRCFVGSGKGNQLAHREVNSNHESTCETCDALGDPSDSTWTQQKQH